MTLADNNFSTSEGIPDISCQDMLPVRLDHETILRILQSDDPELRALLMDKAEACRLQVMGNKVYPRALIEFSNQCDLNCLYCGLRRGNTGLERYHLTIDEIVELALRAWDMGLHSLALQSGEIKDQREVPLMIEAIRQIKKATASNGSEGMGITLSIGELSYDEYRALFEAGAHRYLLRIETSDPDLFRRIHPRAQSYDRRLQCLSYLKEIGYQVGTGVMVGLPGQTYEQLAGDLEFFREWDIDMLGMGPYITHPDTPLARSRLPVIDYPFATTLKMMALARLTMPEINMVCSTALQTIDPAGLSMGIKAGANVVMPVMTPEEHRREYTLYSNKKYSSLNKLVNNIAGIGYELVLNSWGDSRHYYKRRNMRYPVQ
ncbi:MAG: [FeFe] hydrogenase H-cluster radical SAM maturase HydE [Deltaproteobacteria bacterium]